MTYPSLLRSLAFLVPLVTWTEVQAQEPGPVVTQDREVRTLGQPNFTRYRLDNGLEVILHRDNSLPMVAVNVWYHVGPVNEPVGRSGFAHLFEHLMFEGTLHVGPNFDRYLESAGATNANGTTSWDRTNYFETVPREQLELVLWLESDRMGFLRDTITQERLDIQREVVLNERRQSYENAPYGPSTLTLLDILFPVGHPYHGAIIGSPDDLRAATLSDVIDFADKYYAPSNATLCLAGDFDPIAARALVDKYFGTLRRTPRPVRQVTVHSSSPQATRVVVPEPVKVPKVTFAWLVPPAYTIEHAGFEVLSAVLAGGKASRLYRSLVVSQQVAVDVEAEVDANRLATLFAITALAHEGTSVELLEARLLQQLALLIEQPVGSSELLRAKRRIALNYATELQLLNGSSGETGRAGILQRFNEYRDDPGAFDEWQRQLEQIKATDLVRLARRFLTGEARVAVITTIAPEERKP